MRKLFTIYLKEPQDFPNSIILQGHKLAKKLPYFQERIEFEDALDKLLKKQLDTVFD